MQWKFQSTHQTSNYKLFQFEVQKFISSAYPQHAPNWATNQWEHCSQLKKTINEFVGCLISLCDSNHRFLFLITKLLSWALNLLDKRVRNAPFHLKNNLESLASSSPPCFVSIGIDICYFLSPYFVHSRFAAVQNPFSFWISKPKKQLPIWSER